MDSVAALGLPDFILLEFPPVPECLLIGKETVLTDLTLTFFAVSLQERPTS